VPTVPAASVVVVTESCGFTVRVSCLVAVCVCVSESVTVTVKVVPVLLGVPEITPVAPFSVNPSGKAPVVTCQLSGETPPVAANVVEYADPSTPVGSDVVVTLKAGAVIVMLRLFVADPIGTSASLTFTVKVTGPVTLPVGVPVIAPVLAFNESPAGSEPTMLHAYGVMPPVAANVWL